MKTVKGKILINFLIISLVTILCVGGICAAEIFKIVTNQMKNDGSTIVNMVERDISEHDLTELNKINTILEDIKNKSVKNIAYLSLTDKNHKIVASDNKNVIGEKIKNSSYIDKVIKEKKEDGLITKNIDGRRVYNVSVPFYKNEEVVGTVNIGISLENMYQLIRNTIIKILILGLIIVLISLIIANFISKKISSPIVDIVNKMNKVSNGDFSIEFHAKGDDEISILMESLNKTMTTIRNMMEAIKEAIMKVDVVAQNVSAATEEKTDASTQIANSVNLLAEGATNQALEINQATNSLIHFGEILDKITDKIINLSESSNTIKTHADKGSTKIDSLVLAIEDVENSFKYVSDKIFELDNSVIKIGEITNVINSIAEQTNLLALNAAIEASRAGESGKGFSVVADEIRKLAEQVLESSKNINMLVETVTKNSNEVSNTTGNVTDKIEVQTESIADTMESFKEILEEVEKLLPHIEEISLSLKDAAQDKDKIVQNIEKVSHISQEFASSTEEISSSVEEQSASMEEISASTQSLTEISDKLANRVDEIHV
ncbi:methyl-accepting chemotaxis protein [Clostridium brassicae]|uniref:Methyl-accepting chemotaxis protein n=1 Tax=Clostridium brassicae TaxID=2999072 RepID=A0ABT4D620_9CLOT|nr:methyl-accepting chemotaxis protein [Clostridium brassicae]MCY6957745.1 methyl-accepting chemotaxis protein [Clostridium brassicae]